MSGKSKSAQPGQLIDPYGKPNVPDRLENPDEPTEEDLLIEDVWNRACTKWMDMDEAEIFPNGIVLPKSMGGTA